MKVYLVTTEHIENWEGMVTRVWVAAQNERQAAAIAALAFDKMLGNYQPGIIGSDPLDPYVYPLRASSYALLGILGQNQVYDIGKTPQLIEVTEEQEKQLMNLFWGTPPGSVYERGGFTQPAEDYICKNCGTEVDCFGSYREDGEDVWLAVDCENGAPLEACPHCGHGGVWWRKRGNVKN